MLTVLTHWRKANKRQYLPQDGSLEYFYLLSRHFIWNHIWPPRVETPHHLHIYANRDQKCANIIIIFDGNDVRTLKTCSMLKNFQHKEELVGPNDRKHHNEFIYTWIVVILAKTKHVDQLVRTSSALTEWCSHKSKTWKFGILDL